MNDVITIIALIIIIGLIFKLIYSFTRAFFYVLAVVVIYNLANYLTQGAFSHTLNNFLNN